MIYLDNAATTKPKFFRKDYSDYWLNSNMPYAYDEQTKVQEAEAKVKKCLGVKGGHVLWFRCASEAAQWLIGQMDKDDIVCSNIEHDSVYNLCYHFDDVYDLCRELGHEVFSYAPMFYTEQYVNQMTGHILPNDKFNSMGGGRSSDDEFEDNDFTSDEWEVSYSEPLFISDFTAAIGHVKLPTNLEEVCEAVWFSGHKFHTEKGIGAMWASDGLFDYLGGTDTPRNQYSLVHGTLDVPACLMLADAMEYACMNIDNNEAEWKMLSDIILKDLRNNGIECKYIADYSPRTHAINALYLEGIEADALANYLALKEIYVGLGHSACADNTDYRVLEAFGYTKEEASQVIRVSFDEDTTIHDIKGLIEAIIDFKRRFI